MVAKRSIEESIQEHFESPRCGLSPERAGLATMKAAMRFRKALRKQSSFWSVSGEGSPQGGDAAPTPFDGLRASSREEVDTEGSVSPTNGSPKNGLRLGGRCCVRASKGEI